MRKGAQGINLCCITSRPRCIGYLKSPAKHQHVNETSCLILDPYSLL